MADRGQQVKKYLQAGQCLALFFIFTGYTFLNANLKDTAGDLVLLLLLVLALPRLIDLRFPAAFVRFFLALFWCFLAMTLASVVFPPSGYVHQIWLVIALYRVLFAAPLVFAVLPLHDLDRPVLRWGLAALCLALAALDILEKQGCAVQDFLRHLSPLAVVHSPWHDKNYAFWQLLLMWGGISLLWRRGRAGNILAAVLLIFSGTAVFLGSSESSKLALVLSGLVFVLAHLLPVRSRSLLYWGAVLATVIAPILWVCLAPLKPLLAPVLPQMEGITVRVELFDSIAGFIRKELVLGYGFGSTPYLRMPTAEVGGLDRFPGGHTHNLVLQFFADQGLFGLVFITALLLLLARYIKQANEESPQAPAVWALLISGLILFSLSYATWRADVVLMYTMWLSLLVAASARPDRLVADWLADNRYRVFFVFLGIAAILCYGVDYLLLAGR